LAEVVLKNVSKVFPGGVTAVKDVSLTVADGELLVLVGPSGCGKSTTLRMIAGLEEADSGDISIDGRVVNDVAPKDRDIAMVFQNYALYPHMTVYDNMAFGLRLRGFSRDEIDSRVKDATAILGIGELLERRPKALSGGQRQRVAVGRAIVRKPKVFLFDEPLSNLDAKLRVEMRAELNKLHQRLGVTMIYVTHDQVEAMTLGDRIVIMESGAIRQVGSPLSVYDTPVDKFVAGFIGTPPMNLMPGRLERRGGAVEWTDGSSTVELPERLAAGAVGLAGGSVSLGVRPEDIRFEGGAGRLPSRVEVVEPLGNEMLVYLSAGPRSIVARSDAHRRLSVGAEAVLGVNVERVHLFDDSSGRSVLAARAGAARGPEAERTEVR
jgi:multiple sugar transport system ATP-binding protein